MEHSLSLLHQAWPGACVGFPTFNEPLAHLLMAAADYLLVPSRYLWLGARAHVRFLHACMPVCTPVCTQLLMAAAGCLLVPFRYSYGLEMRNNESSHLGGEKSPRIIDSGEGRGPIWAKALSDPFTRVHGLQQRTHERFVAPIPKHAHLFLAAAVCLLVLPMSSLCKHRPHSLVTCLLALPVCRHCLLLTLPVC